MNQGCIPSLFSVTGIYISVLFYFVFKEVLTYSHIFGITLMVPCVMLLAFDKKEASTDESGFSYTEQEMRMFGGLAVLFGILGPIFWTFKAFFLRSAIERKTFKTWDIGVDHTLYQAAFQTLIFVAYVCTNELSMDEFWQGQLVGVFFLMGGVFATMAYESGPGGPINAIITTQIIYQTAINAMFFGQDVSTFEFAGIACGIASTVLICLWDDVATRCCKSNKVVEGDDFLAQKDSI